MSKYVKDLITKELSERLAGVENAFLFSVVGMDAVTNTVLRKELRDQNVQLTLIKNSLARRATEGTALAAAFTSTEGSTAIVWGSEDVVSLAKIVTKLSEQKKYLKFEPRGGVLDGSPLAAEDVKKVSKWPNRQEQLSLLVGQILSPGAMLASQLLAPGGALASQIEKKSEEVEGTEATEEAAA